MSNNYEKIEIEGLKCNMEIVKYGLKIALLQNSEVNTSIDHIFQEYFLSDEWDNNTFVRLINRSSALNVAECLTYRRI